MVSPMPVSGGTPGFRWLPAEEIRRNRGWFFALGIGLMVLGVLAIALPFAATLATTMVLGWLLILGGIFELIHGIQNRHWPGATWTIVEAILFAIAGVLLILFPITGTLTLTLILAAFFTISGFVKIVRALLHRSMPRWGWLLFDGLVTLALGALIGLRWPSTAAWAIGLLVGIDLIIGGSSMVMIGVALGPRRHPTPTEAPA
ncbi:MAG: HdeD family acid-resistance protein [Polyangiaceae bacterium]